MRIGGLASGMDIDQLVKDLMKAERMPLDKLTQRKQYLEWQRDDYRNVNKSLLELDTLIFDGIGRQSSFTKKTVSVSNSDALSVKNINSTVDFSGTVKVNELASAATMYSSGVISLDPTKKLSEQGITNPQTIKIKAINKDGTFDNIGYELTFDPANETLDSIIEKINKNSGVNAFFDPVSKKVSLIAKHTGNYDDATPPDPDTDNDPEIVLEGSFFSNTLKLDSNNIVAAAFTRGTVGKNAEIEYNGMTITRASNTFVINGIEFTLKEKTTGPVTFSSTTDTDAIVETIKKFVDKYNEVIAQLNSKIDEKRYRSFQPLTKEQREAMSEKEIELWEEKAKSGTLRSDSIITSGLSKMRQDLYGPVSGITSEFNQLAAIGITTSSNYLDKGKLEINVDKLKKALSEDPNAVYELFNKDGTTAAEQGIGKRLRSTIKATMTDIEKKAGKSYSVNNSFVLGRNLDDLDKQISKFEAKLIQVEDRYWRQFTAMEKAIQRANEQSVYLMQQFGGGS
jgi:flagellar hook-associated protein 2